MGSGLACESWQCSDAGTGQAAELLLLLGDFPVKNVPVVMEPWHLQGWRWGCVGSGFPCFWWHLKDPNSYSLCDSSAVHLKDPNSHSLCDSSAVCVHASYQAL